MERGIELILDTLLHMHAEVGNSSAQNMIAKLGLFQHKPKINRGELLNFGRSGVPRQPRYVKSVGLTPFFFIRAEVDPKMRFGRISPKLMHYPGEKEFSSK